HPFEHGCAVGTRIHQCSNTPTVFERAYLRRRSEPEMTAPAPIPAQLDHVILAGPDLPEAISAVEQLTGVRAAPGGKHPTGTANALIAFTVGGRRVPHYLELIGPDPEG